VRPDRPAPIVRRRMMGAAGRRAETGRRDEGTASGLGEAVVVNTGVRGRGGVRYRLLPAYGPPTGVLNEIAKRPQGRDDLDYEVELLPGGAAHWHSGRLTGTEGDTKLWEHQP